MMRQTQALRSWTGTQYTTNGSARNCWTKTVVRPDPRGPGMIVMSATYPLAADRRPLEAAEFAVRLEERGQMAETVPADAEESVQQPERAHRAVLADLDGRMLGQGLVARRAVQEKGGDRRRVRIEGLVEKGDDVVEGLGGWFRHACNQSFHAFAAAWL